MFLRLKNFYWPAFLPTPHSEDSFIFSSSSILAIYLFVGEECFNSMKYILCDNLEYSILNSFPSFISIIIIIIIHSEPFTSAIADGFSLMSEWQQVSSPGLLKYFKNILNFKMFKINEIFVLL